MAWYYYNGNTILSIQIGNGEVIAARPHSTFFVDPTAENSAAFKRQSRVLRRTGAPRGAIILVPEKPISGEIVVHKNVFSESFIEGKDALKNGSDTPIAKVYVESVVAPVAPVETQVEAEVDADTKDVAEEVVDDVDAETESTESDVKLESNIEGSVQKRKRRGTG
jgi:hypothetical protein